ncbi:MAG: hypothetical protein OXP07_02605 [Defluviicoccus sp.]|nr:hypothetical protein [Defluviicoccus sp.]
MTVHVAGFLGLAALMVALFAWMRLDIKALRGEMREEMRQTEARINDRFERLEARVAAMEVRLAAVERGQAKLEGLLEGLREAIAGRAVAE